MSGITRPLGRPTVLEPSLAERVERRRLLTASVIGGALVATGLAACQNQGSAQPGNAAGGENGEEGISAVEDLMREHGVLRRILIVYQETAFRLARDPARIDAAALGDAATLFRQFGEDYHERGLEERFLFPELQQSGGEAGGLVDTLLAQHQRGREITDYVLQTLRGGSIATAAAEPLSRALLTMNRMYEAHAAWEDTVVFPAWKELMEPARLRELAETFEEIEHQQFGEDGFDEAIRRVRSIEQRLGVADLASFTAPATSG